MMILFLFFFSEKGNLNRVRGETVDRWAAADEEDPKRCFPGQTVPTHQTDGWVQESSPENVSDSFRLRDATKSKWNYLQRNIGKFILNELVVL